MQNVTISGGRGDAESKNNKHVHASSRIATPAGAVCVSVRGGAHTLRRATLFLLVLVLAGCSGRLAWQHADETGEDTAAAAPAAPGATARPDYTPRPPVRAGRSETRPGGDRPTPAPPPDDLWERLRAGFRLPEIEHPRLARERRWYASHGAYMERVAERARPYLFHVVREAERRRLPLELALLPVVESAFQPFAYSRSHAAGLWQFVPATGLKYGLKQNWWYDGRRDVLSSTRAAFDYLQALHTEFDGNWLLAVAAYNSGEGNVQRAIHHNRRRGKPTDFWSLRLPQETRKYVPRLLAVASIVAHPERYGVSLSPIPNEPYFAVVPVDGQIDLALAADMAKVAPEELRRLNPGFKRWATDPEGPHRILVPRERAQPLRAALAELAPEERVRWRRHRVHQGETLTHIARRYDTRVAVLQELNELRGSLIRAGASLIVPARGQLDDGTRRLAASDDPGSLPAVYRVRRGDTLWDIARRHRLSVAELRAWNGLGERTLLRVGQELALARPALSQTGSGARTSAAVLERVAQRRVRYTVRPGDSLWAISRRFDVSMAALRRWNDLRPDAYLHPGQELDVYVGGAGHLEPS